VGADGVLLPGAAVLLSGVADVVPRGAVVLLPGDVVVAPTPAPAVDALPVRPALAPASIRPTISTRWPRY
jgi:hypothetical protein